MSQLFSGSPRCQIVPLPHHQLAIGIDGRERLRWHSDPNDPRPFFFPLIGPSGLPLTRMGHPGAPNHDHHCSIWFAHHKVLGIDFWSNLSSSQIRQQHWLAYQDGDEEALMAVQLGWFDGHDPTPLIDQQVIASIAPADEDGLLLEITTSLTSRAESLELQQTNFGLLAVRVAADISARFGDGVLTGADGAQTEKKLFGNANAWIDYSGSVKPGVIEGITYFDHPSNPSFPSKWHVRDDGWMGASINRDGPHLLTPQPSTWRYLLHAHPGPADAAISQEIASRFHTREPLVVERSEQSHVQYSIRRAT